MAPRRRQRFDVDPHVLAASLAICTARCHDYANKARTKHQDILADVYEGFLLLIQEYAEDCGSGIRGRVLIDPVTF